MRPNANKDTRRRLLRGAGLLLVAAVTLLVAVSPTNAEAAGASCRAITSESQVEHVNHLVEEGAVKEVAWWGQKSIRPELVSQQGGVGRFRMTHPKKGDAHLAFDYGCRAFLKVVVDKREETCEPNGALEKFVCAKRWFTTATKERTISLDRPFSLHLTYDRDRRVTVLAEIPHYFIPGLYVLDAEVWTKPLVFGGR